MTLEQLLAEALSGTDDFLPSPDLFAKVQRSIEEDATRRRRIRRSLGWIAAGAAVAIVWVAAFLDVGGGTTTMPWWSVEVLTVAVLATLVIVLGPLIRRFGRMLTLEVFGSNQATSDRFLALLDIAYYLIFAAYILMSTSFSAPAGWGGTLAPQLEHEVMRAGGLLLVMGILHALTIAVLPVIRVVFASNWRRAARAELGDAAPPPDPAAEKADRVATIIVWLAAAGFGAFVLLNAIPAILAAVLGAG